MEHIELAGIHSGDSACILPSKHISEENLKTIKEYTRRIAEEMHVVGLMNMQYAIENGKVFVGNKTEYSQGRFGRFQGMSQNLSYTINNQKAMTFFNLLRGRGWSDLFANIGGRKDKDDRENEDEENDEAFDTDDGSDDANIDPDLKKGKEGKAVKAGVDEDGYLLFSLPWSLTFSYGISMRENTQAQINVRRMRYPYAFTHTLSFSGFVRLAEGWNVSFTSGYDFNYHDLSMTKYVENEKDTPS